MKSIPSPILSVVVSLGLLTTSASAANATAGMQEGKPDIKSMGPIAFGPDGVLFVADSKSAAIFAIATGDTQSSGNSDPLKVDSINVKIAGLLGTTAEDILIEDLAINPKSRTAYLAVSRGRGPDAVPVLIRVGSDGSPKLVSLDSVKFSKAELPDPPVDGMVGEGRRQQNPRMESITDVGFMNDRVLVAGLSNEEFASTLRAIPFPFQQVEEGTVVEIFHGAHGRFETRSPVRTFVSYNIDNQPHVLAAYTCTPLVQFSVDELKPGAKITGKTIAELGNRNRPLDMIVYQKDGRDYLLLANSSRGIMKVSTEGIAGAESIEDRVEGETEGLPYETISSWTGINQLDRLDTGNAVVVRELENGSLNLESMPLP